MARTTTAKPGKRACQRVGMETNKKADEQRAREERTGRRGVARRNRLSKDGAAHLGKQHPNKKKNGWTMCAGDVARHTASTEGSG